MGRIKTNLTKRTAILLYKTNANVFKTDFESNKKIVESKIEVRSKKLRNIIAGYLTRLTKKEE